jgi:hypothetical protein
VLPLLDTAGRIHGLQFLRTSAQAREGEAAREGVLASGLIKKGHFHLIGAPQHLVLVAEGYATGATLHEATGYPVAIAFDAGNLAPVVAALRSALQAQARILICADDDASATATPASTAPVPRRWRSTAPGWCRASPTRPRAAPSSKPTATSSPTSTTCTRWKACTSCAPRSKPASRSLTGTLPARVHHHRGRGARRKAQADRVDERPARALLAGVRAQRRRLRSPGAHPAVAVGHARRVRAQGHPPRLGRASGPRHRAHPRGRLRSDRHGSADHLQPLRRLADGAEGRQVRSPARAAAVHVQRRRQRGALTTGCSSGSRTRSSTRARR